VNERLHHPEFGAGLGGGALFEPLDGALASVVQVRLHGSLERALGDRIEIVDLAIERTDETTLEANVSYRLRGAADSAKVTVTLNG
jgi:phage baseplate assembly protein W